LSGVQKLAKIPHFFEEIAQYISLNFPYVKKVVELGVGFSPWTALKLRQLLPNAEILVVDKNPEALKELEPWGLRAIKDDVFNPNLRIYEDAGLIYSIHPPLELINPIKLLAEKIGAAILVKPLSEDAYLYGFDDWRRVRLSSCTIYVLQR